MRSPTWQQVGALALLLSAAGLAIATPPRAPAPAAAVTGGECAPGPPAPAADTVAAGELARWVADGRVDVAVLDVRTPEEYADYHIPGAVNVPLTRLLRSTRDAGLPAAGTLVVCAADTVSAEQGRLALVAEGRKVRLLADGIAGWWRETMTPGSVAAAGGGPDDRAAWEARRKLRDQLERRATESGP